MRGAANKQLAPPAAGLADRPGRYMAEWYIHQLYHAANKQLAPRPRAAGAGPDLTDRPWTLAAGLADRPGRYLAEWYIHQLYHAANKQLAPRPRAAGHQRRP
ncbi:MAG TPA: hypothetical protein VFW71_10830 [Actinomycetota bacterium]|nr:hypothetical protein [Actinomycetota bacterium]